MSRPPEGLGDAFSCRLAKEHDELARAERARTNSPLSHVVRMWVTERFALVEENAYLKARLLQRSKKLDQKYGLIPTPAKPQETPAHGE